jgi:RNA polymerase sigma-70 factor (ECF subfamily)
LQTEIQRLSDEELAGQAQAGSLSDFEELVHRYEARIFRFVANSFRNPSDAQEVTQETFVSAFLNLRQFDVQRSFATWLFTIARRKCIDRHRAARPAADGEMPELPDLNDPAVLLSRREAEQDLWATARRSLPELHFHALWLRYAEEMNLKDIARVLQKTQVHVKVLLFRARTRLARELESQRTQEKAGGTRYTSPKSLRPLDKSGTRVTRPSELSDARKRLLSAET